MKNSSSIELELNSILKELSKFDLSDHYFSLTINYEKIVSDYKSPKFDIDQIKDILSKISKIDTFNLTITNHSGYDEERYKSYWFTSFLSIYSDGISLRFLSSDLSTDPNGIEVQSIHKLMDLYDFYRKISKELYDKIKE
jgi:hypothetical protein